jgi:hypothetical protein
MSTLALIITGLKRIVRPFLNPVSDFFAIRRDWPECCRDSDARARAVEAMRDECWRTGV